METIWNIVKLIRVKHWVKNLCVFLPAFFAARLDLLFAPRLLFIFFAFCMAASAIYVINDLADVEKDRLHPRKCKRPLASGFFSTRDVFVILGVILILFSIMICNLKHAWAYILFYFAMNLLYTFRLKQISIIDVTCISLGFVFRVLAGGSEVEVYVSHWMVTIVFLLAISMAFAKRRDDLVLKLGVEKKQLRESLGNYTLQFLDVAKSIALSITLVSYIIYSTSPDVIERVGSDKVYLTSLFVFLGIMRYLQITIVDENSGSPTDVLLRDRFIQLTVVLWLASFVVILYGKNL